MQNKIQLIVFFLAGILSKASGDLYRFILIEELKTWPEAQSYCREKYTDLATVQSDEDRAKLKELATAVNFQSYAWIGFNRDVWRWSYQNTAISYVKWESFQPDFSSTDMACGNLNSNGRWSDTSCTDEKYFFCQTDKQDTLQDKFKHIDSIKMNWRDAQIHCKTYYLDLATITDDTENAFLANELSLKGLMDTWIGLYKNMTQWLWSDESSVSFSSVKWMPGQPDNINGNQDCARINTDELMTDYTCFTPLPFYCRENRKIQRVRFALKSDGHLDESAVMEVIEKKIKQILSDQDMEITSSIKWSVQPDGKIFQQQKTQENKKQERCQQEC